MITALPEIIAGVEQLMLTQQGSPLMINYQKGKRSIYVCNSGISAGGGSLIPTVGLDSPTPRTTNLHYVLVASCWVHKRGLNLISIQDAEAQPANKENPHCTSTSSSTLTLL